MILDIIYACTWWVRTRWVQMRLSVYQNLKKYTRSRVKPGLNLDSSQVKTRVYFASQYWLQVYFKTARRLFVNCLHCINRKSALLFCNKKCLTLEMLHLVFLKYLRCVLRRSSGPPAIANRIASAKRSLWRHISTAASKLPVRTAWLIRPFVSENRKD